MNKLRQSYSSVLNSLTGGREDNIYSLKSRLKIYLFIIGMLIISASSIYTYFLAERLKDQERVQMAMYQQAMGIMSRSNADEYLSSLKAFLLEIANENDNMPTQKSVKMEAQNLLVNNDAKIFLDSVGAFLLNITQVNNDIPIILTDEKYNILDARNVNGVNPDGIFSKKDSQIAISRLNKMIASRRPPIYLRDDSGALLSKIYYDDSNNLTLLKYYPFFQFILIAFFVGFGYLTFSAVRRSEQNQVWVGMAKETAHQLGTPIAAILGWIEHLRSSHEEDEMTQEVVNELQNDVNRLSLVADRFSKIGSTPELVPVNIYEELDRCREYMQKRSPRKVKFDFPSLKNENSDEPKYLFAEINSHLFDWVVENLLRNALDAMEGGEGTISAKIYEEAQWTCIDITDTGKGIPKNKFHTVFQPGFTTKKRGWGLGLSLAKRIIENYHGGKILVKDSELNKFTTFTIKLPKS